MSKISDKQMAQAEKKIKESEAMIRSMTPQASSLQELPVVHPSLASLCHIKEQLAAILAGRVHAGCRSTIV